MNKNAYPGMRNEARMAILDFLNENEDFYLCDLHSIVFNDEPHFIYYGNAIEVLNEEGIYQLFDTIEEIVQYEKNAFGEINTDFSNPCDVANMLWYIIGEEELYEMFDGCKEFEEWWSEEIGEPECNVLLAWLKDNNKI